MQVFDKKNQKTNFLGENCKYTEATAC